ncbi:MAG TPA: hypothetical protein PLE45_05350 [Spirochaetota bacterium]|nr:hypothetical protein [Spirochaetota bacterium]HOL57150.1 hypothetical protein [Spirochaetota bacterium]HPP03906.1 hypothetical protein [Spirochaetota bacterium]
MRRKVISLIIICLLISCKTITTPIIYDKNQKSLDNNIKIMTQLLLDKKYEALERELFRFLTIYKDNEDLLLLKGWLLLQTKKYKEAEAIFLSLLEKNKKNLLCYAGLARLYRIQNKKDLAEQKISEALKVNQFFSIIWFEKGMLEYENREYEKAIISFTRAINIDYKNYDAKFFRYLCYLKTGRELDDVKDIWESIVKAGILKPEYFLYHAYTLYEIEKYKSFSLIVLKDGLNKFPDDPYLLNMYSYLLFEKYKESRDEKYLIEAKESIVKCFDIAKNIEIEFVDTYLVILKEIKDYQKMKELINEYYLLYPDSDIIKFWLKESNLQGGEN